jgi:microcystin-dependent protein
MAVNNNNSPLRATKSPNLPIAPIDYSQQYIDQLTNALRLYFTQVDNFTQAAVNPTYGPTADRPIESVQAPIPVGQTYFDTTISTLLIWDGTAWVSAIPTSASPVTSFSAGTTGLTPNVATTGAVTLGGVLSVANGGTGSSSGVVSVITGSIQMWPTGTAPTGYLLCNGASVSTTTYAALFAVVGYTFGGSGGSFLLPNYTNRMPYGTTIGATGGSADAIVVSHTHSTTDPGHFHAPPSGLSTPWLSNPFSGDGAIDSSGTTGPTERNAASGNTQSKTTGISINSAGSSGTNANLPPYLGINFIIKT